MSVSRSAALSDGAHFQRGGAGGPIRKPRRTFILRIRHAVALLVGAAILFFAAYELYAFVITWPRLEVKEIRTSCADPGVATLAAEAMGSRAWGNLLLLDMALVRAEARTVPWVKDARVRKVFPSALAVEIVPRTAAALLEKEIVVLVDETGVVIEPSDREAHPDLPLFTDEAKFRNDGETKLRRALVCWNNLRPEDRPLVDTIDVTFPDDVILRFRGSGTRVRLGDDLFGLRTAAYLASREKWEREFGPLESVLLGLTDRVVLQPRGAEGRDGRGPAAKEKN